jgi:hypothetical protein
LKRAREPPLGGPQQRHHGSSGSEDTERAERARKRQFGQNEETENLEESTDKSRQVKRRDKVFDRGK